MLKFQLGFISLDKIDNCAPVSHSTCDSMSFNKHLSVHRRLTNLAIFVYSREFQKKSQEHYNVRTFEL